METGQEPVFVFYTGDLAASRRGRALIQAVSASTKQVLEVSDPVMAAMAATRTPQGIIAVLPFPEVAPGESPLILVLDRLRDPGNLGTILRSAVAASVGQVITIKGTVDVLNPKVVRGAMGAHFRVPISCDRNWDEIGADLEGRQVLLADPQGRLPYYEVDWAQPTALIVGGEARGAGGEAKRLASDTVTVPMQGGTESLNVAVATSIILFEAARQRAVSES